MEMNTVLRFKGEFLLSFLCLKHLVFYVFFECSTCPTKTR